MNDWQLFQKHNWWMSLLCFVTSWVAIWVHNWAMAAGLIVMATLLYCTGVIISAMKDGD